MIGIIGAMDTEVDNIKAQVKGKTVSEIAGVEFVCGFIEDVTVCVAKCSPGKVNAALCAQAMIDNFDIEMIINVGVACSLSNDVVIKNVVIASDVCEYDIDITALGEPRGFINGLNVIKVKADEKISELTEKLTIAKEANWLYEKFGDGEYHDILGLCKVAYTTDDAKCDDKDGISIEEKGWSLTPGAYVGVAPVEDDGVDFEERMTEIHRELLALQEESNDLMNAISRNMKEMGL